MDFLTWLVIFALQNAIITGYPIYRILQDKEDPKERKMWLLYFLTLGLLSILEGTILFPIIYL